LEIGGFNILAPVFESLRASPLHEWQTIVRPWSSFQAWTNLTDSGRTYPAWTNIEVGCIKEKQPEVLDAMRDDLKKLNNMQAFNTSNIIFERVSDTV
jgi:hypothetical protein